MNEIVFVVEDDPDGGYTARALGEDIFTQAENMPSLREMVRDAVRCHFPDADKRPKMLRVGTRRSAQDTFWLAQFLLRHLAGVLKRPPNAPGLLDVLTLVGQYLDNDQLFKSTSKFAGSHRNLDVDRFSRFDRRSKQN
jgi:hypothetical protein